MKSLLLKSLAAAFTLAAICLSAPDIFAQNDVVVMANGDIKQGKVTAMEDNAVKFVHSGEELEYSLKKSEISKIQFASGRVQEFGGVAQASVSASAAPVATAPVATSTAEERKGKLAVVPIDVISNDPGINAETMGTQIQHEAVNSFRSHSRGISVQDPRTTTSILLKNNIDQGQLAAMAPGEVATILGVEYVAYGVVNIQNEGTMTTGSAVTTYKDKEDKSYSSDERHTRNKGTEVSSGSSSTTVNYDCKVELSIYNDQGSNVYSDSRDAFGLSQDSYNNGLNYMIRRTPFGDKHK
ncbi:MAG: hypothetical protein DHS20C17_07940 [Cyclobacteriaceae bacterium]|nr:MAG: hypothetical protein DHS20C17_07940 [Cyclobacteriaceae bacterium]